MELAWNTQKNQMTDVKGKEKEQERDGKIKNDDIDPERTKHNYDLVESNKNLYQRVKARVDYAKANGSRVQKNSVVMYSNVLTVPEEQAKVWGKERTRDYFQSCHDFFSKGFGRENVVSAKVHLDESTPHMHLHFVPFNKETGKLQARVAMDRKKVNQIHNELPSFLQERGFEVERGKGKTKDKNIENVHEYKAVQQKISEKEKELKALIDTVPDKQEQIPFEKEVTTEVVKTGLFQKEQVQKETGNVVLTPDQFEDLTKKANAAVTIKSDYERLKKTNLVKENEKLRDIASRAVPQIKKQKNQIEELKKENMSLKAHISHLKHDIKLTYKTTKEFVKERTDGLKAFRGAFKSLIDKIQEKTQKSAERTPNEPRTNEFVKEHGKTLKEERDKGMEL